MRDYIIEQHNRQIAYRSRKMYVPTMEEKVAIMKDCKETGLVLLEHYANMKSNASFSDQAVASNLCWNWTKVQRVRISLEQNGYFKRINFSSSNGRKLTRYIIGKTLVDKDNKQEEAQLNGPKDVEEVVDIGFGLKEGD